MVLAAGLFIVIFLIAVLCAGLALAYLRSRDNNQIKAMLKTADPVVAERSAALLRPAAVDNALTRFFQSTGVLQRLNRVIEQSGLHWGAAHVLITTIFGIFIGMVVGSQLPPIPYREWAVLFLVVCFGCLPFAIVIRKRTARIAAFEEQFPEALDFLARSLRAGHAFTIGLEMLVHDSPEPLGSVFRKTLNDLRVGSPLETALKRLMAEIPMVDVQFFVASVLLQQETGGNLSEILSKLSYVIRQRFLLKGHVRAASAHGRITGAVLIAMPIAVAAVMTVTSPAYLLVLFVDPLGRLMLTGALVAQALGLLCIKKITDIKV